MTVDTPRREDAFSEAVFTRATDVIHDFIAAIFHDGFSNPCCDVFKRFVPTDTFPFSFTTFPGALQRIKNAIGIGDLVECRGTLGAVAPARSRMFGIAFKLLYFACYFVDIGKQAAS